MCEVASYKNFENSLTTVKVMTKTIIWDTVYVYASFTTHMATSTSLVENTITKFSDKSDVTQAC